MSRSIVENAFQAFVSNDPDKISAVLAEDAEWLSPPGNATAVALERTNHMVGREAIVRFFAEDFPRLFVRDVAVTVHSLRADAEWATVEATVAATLSNGNHYDNDYCFVIELRDGRIHRVREYVDTARGNRLIFDGLDAKGHNGVGSRRRSSGHSSQMPPSPPT
ncbi:nuclear transport factor 2 family protein [Nocardia transvalensis]|uniref:nuclear transport factor 2 family protein n=1 Tax=Nocardia transvalensis TaxID=37333 RepID=UPI001892D4F4|nr:nuclear transport factor 2 family protein [Nocardia transvalensis]MBF6330931.1 nuclear transport factor 2 family protein [Nocardia transvalensis]